MLFSGIEWREACGQPSYVGGAFHPHSLLFHPGRESVRVIPNPKTNPLRSAMSVFHSEIPIFLSCDHLARIISQIAAIFTFKTPLTTPMTTSWYLQSANRPRIRLPRVLFTLDTKFGPIRRRRHLQDAVDDADDDQLVLAIGKPTPDSASPCAKTYYHQF